MSSGYVVAAFAVGLFWVCGTWNRQEEKGAGEVQNAATLSSSPAPFWKKISL